MEKKAGRLFAAWSLAAALCLLGGVPAQASEFQRIDIQEGTGITSDANSMPEDAREADKEKELSLNVKRLTVKVGGSKKLTAEGSLAGAADKKVSWYSSNKKVAKVKNGKVTGISVGNATITAKAGGKKASCRVKVTLSRKAKRAIQAYRRYLRQDWIEWSDNPYKGKYQQDEFRFVIADVNADGVPELVLSNIGQPSHYEGYEAVYCYRDKEIRELTRNDKIKCYYPKTGYVVTQYFGMGYHSFYYKISEDGTVSQMGSEDIQVTDAPKDAYWYWDKQEVTESQFYQLVEKSAGKDPVEIEESDFSANTEANRKNMAKLIKF